MRVTLWFFGILTDLIARAGEEPAPVGNKQHLVGDKASGEGTWNYSFCSR